MNTPKDLDTITEAVLRYRPPEKLKAAKKRAKRKRQRDWKKESQSLTALDYYHIMNHMETANDIGGLCKCLHVDRNGVPCRHAWYKRIPGRPAMCPRCLSRQWDSAKTPKAVTVTEKVETGENTNDF